MTGLQDRRRIAIAELERDNVTVVEAQFRVLEDHSELDLEGDAG